MKPLFILLLFPLFCQSQKKAEYADFEIPTKDGKPFYEHVDSVNKTKDEIFAAAKKAISDMFGSAKAVIEIDDKEAGQIICKCMLDVRHKIQLGVNETTTVKFSVNIQIKDGRYRIQIYDFTKRSSTESEYYILDRVLSQAKGWRERFFPAFHDHMTAFILLFSSKTFKNLSASDF